MCSGHRKLPSAPLSPPCGPIAMENSGNKDEFSSAFSLLLELSAADDLAGFKKAVEEEGAPICAAAPWYGRSAGRSRRIGMNLRTPMQIAAVYGSNSVLSYILSVSSAGDVNHRSGDDAATALHLAAAGGSASSVEAVKLLIAATADVDAVDASGNRPADLIPQLIPGSMTKILEGLLKASCPRVPSPSKEMEAKQGGRGGEKKEFPPDLTLPDIKNGIYGTDEFRMYSFKIKPCSRAYSHDWTECPFVHPGENARRRDPRKYLYSCVPCPEFRKGSCRNGDGCEYAHGVFECWLHPAQYRTRLCKDETGCNRRVCFFAHKPEELRSVNSASGLVVSSPRSPAAGLGMSSLDMAAAMMLMQQPSSPSMSSALGSSVWMNQTTGAVAPTLQLPSSRLKSTLGARDLELELDLMALEGYHQKLMDAPSPRANWTANSLAATRASEYSDLLGSLPQLESFSLKQSAAAYQSLYANKPPSSPSVRTSPSISGLDHSLATAIMNSRSSAFAKRSQSFIDRGAIAARQSTLAPMTATVAPTSGLSDWGSPSGKLDWGIQGEELNKLRKSASFGFRSNASSFPASAATAAAMMDEPDLSWVQSLVKDAATSEMLPAWAEEQIMA